MLNFLLLTLSPPSSEIVRQADLETAFSLSRLCKEARTLKLFYLDVLCFLLGHIKKKKGSLWQQSSTEHRLMGSRLGTSETGEQLHCSWITPRDLREKCKSQ